MDENEDNAVTTISRWKGAKCTLTYPLTQRLFGRRRDRDASVDAADAPIEIGGCQDLVGNGSFFSRTKNTFNALRPFWLPLSMFFFGIIAFVVGTITTLIGAFVTME